MSLGTAPALSTTDNGALCFRPNIWIISLALYLSLSLPLSLPPHNSLLSPPSAGAINLRVVARGTIPTRAGLTVFWKKKSSERAIDRLTGERVSRCTCSLGRRLRDFMMSRRLNFTIPPQRWWGEREREREIDLRGSSSSAFSRFFSRYLAPSSLAFFSSSLSPIVLEWGRERAFWSDQWRNTSFPPLL